MRISYFPIVLICFIVALYLIVVAANPYLILIPLAVLFLERLWVQETLYLTKKARTDMIKAATEVLTEYRERYDGSPER
jgi:hypothetical protein